MKRGSDPESSHSVAESERPATHPCVGPSLLASVSTVSAGDGRGPARGDFEGKPCDSRLRCALATMSLAFPFSRPHKLFEAMGHFHYPSQD